MSININMKDKTISFKGSLTFENVNTYYEKLNKSKIKDINIIDLQNLELIDSSGIALIDNIIHNSVSNTTLNNVPKQIQDAIHTFSSKNISLSPPVPKTRPLEKAGELVYNAMLDLKSFVFLTSEIVILSITGIFNRKGQRKGSILQQCLLLGVDSVGIISLLSFILGFILALQSAAQLRQFGANIFVADLLAISMVREMGPMMTAIIVAGRSGSSIASEIATMKVTEEIDALKTMAINPVQYIMVPKFIAITVCMPLLVTISVSVGIIGGLTIAVTYLDLSVASFFHQLFSTLTIKDEIIGLSKSFFFAWNIVLVACFYGLKVEGGAEGVGIVTTKSVVAAIFGVIIFDAIFSLFYMI